jgi:hypothetical protein
MMHKHCLRSIPAGCCGSEASFDDGTGCVIDAFFRSYGPRMRGMISLAAVMYIEKLFLLAQAWLRRLARGRLPGIYVPMYVRSCDLSPGCWVVLAFSDEFWNPALDLQTALSSGHGPQTWSTSGFESRGTDGERWMGAHRTGHWRAPGRTCPNEEKQRIGIYARQPNLR